MFERSGWRTLLAMTGSLVALAACGQNAGDAGQQAADTAPEAASRPAASVDADARFDRTLEDYTLAYLKARPRLASELNLPESQAGGRYKDRFETPGIEGHLERQELDEAFMDRLKTIDPESLSEDRREYLAILLSGNDAESQLRSIAEREGYFLAGGFSSPYVVSQVDGIHVNLPQFMTQAHALETVDDAQAYIARLNLFDEAFDGVIDIYDANAAAGVLPPDYAIEGALESTVGFASLPVDQNPLYTHFEAALDAMAPANREDLLGEARMAITASVIPAYQRLAEALRTSLPDATHDAGIWDLPGGPELYELLVKVVGESELSGEGVHELGLSEVARIQSEMEELFARIDLTEGPVGERLAALTADPAQLFPNTEEGKQELLAYVRELAAEAEAVMADYFIETPSIGFEVRPVPAYAEQGAPGGYYSSPPPDGSRPGLYFINLRDTAAQPKFSLPTLTYHEGVPGHHFQLALAAEAADVPLLVRQEASSNGFVEGWALYSEQFAEEIGLYEDDPYGNIGRLRDELFRAVRLVVDSGMHARKWSREEAIEYMVANAGMERSGVTSEIERYSAWPAQALAYKTGMLKIQALRARAAKALGEDFDIAAFHYEVLRGGGAPLTVLEARIDRWIAAGGPRPAAD